MATDKELQVLVDSHSHLGNRRAREVAGVGGREIVVGVERDSEGANPMIIINGKTPLGWRLDEIGENMAVGMDFVASPFAIVPLLENAKRIEQTMNASGHATSLLPPTCPVCAGKLAKIRGRYPGEADRPICPTCVVEKLEDFVSGFQVAMQSVKPT